MSFLMELWAFLRTRKKYWLAPVVVVLMLFGALLVLAESSAIAPFIYTLF
jgi:drug/metabolite transporter superfamily protein YnfA